MARFGEEGVGVVEVVVDAGAVGEDAEGLQRVDRVERPRRQRRQLHAQRVVQETGRTPDSYVREGDRHTELFAQMAAELTG